MALTVNFYNFSKKNNSTKVPSGTGTEAPSTYQCILKEDCSILAPVIIMEAGLTSRLAFNYCYIADFQRYYYVTDWNWSGRHWIASLTVDVLATYKTDIGNASLYVLRSASHYNGRVQDTRYPVIAKPYTYIDSIGNYVGTTWTDLLVYENDSGTDYAVSNFFNATLSSGYWYLGVTGANGTGVKWYVMNATGFNGLVQSLYAFIPTDMTDVSNGIAMQLADPMQYIVSCYWLPYLIHGAVLDQNGTDLKFGNYTIRAYYSTTFDPVSNINKFHAAFNIRKHPQAATRGAYLNGSPYTRYTVVFPPFGTFELDPSLMIDDSVATCEWYVDYSTGIADLTIKVTNSFMVHTSSMLGVPIRLSQAVIDYAGMGGATGALAIAGAADFSKYWGDLGGFMNKAVGAVSSIAVQPKITSKGSTGNFIPFKALTPKIYTDFYEIANEDNTDMGRPLCEVKTLSTLSGYFVCEEGDIVLNSFALDPEIDQVRSYLTGGMFYE